MSQLSLRLLLGLWWIFAQSPWHLQYAVSRLLGGLVVAIKPRRYRIARRNLQLCLPDISGAERQRILRRHCSEMMLGCMEAGMAYWWPRRRLLRRIRVEGGEHLQRPEGCGVMVLCYHFTNLEMGRVSLASMEEPASHYRPHDNPLVDAVILRGRRRAMRPGAPPHRMFPRHDLRGLIRHLRGGGMATYMPDQDYGPRGAHFPPFFGIPAATLGAARRLAAASGARVLVAEHGRKGTQYWFRLHPLPGFPGPDEQADLRRINAVGERLARRNIDNYLWMHRRFKTRPPGAPDLYEGI